MLCRNCGNPILDTAKFCSSCGQRQPVAPPSHPASADSAPPLPTIAGAFEASDVTVILPRRRADALVAPAKPGDQAAASPSFASKNVSDRLQTHRSSARAIKIGGAAVVVILAVFAAAAFYAKRPGAPAAKADAPVASTPQPMSAPMPAATQSDQPRETSTKTEGPIPPPINAATAVNAAPIAESSIPPEATAPVSAQGTVAPPKDAPQRKKARAPTTPVPEAAAVDNPAPQPAPVAPPQPAPVTAAPPAEPAKVERVACADNANPFSREICLWQECAKPQFRTHDECARFTGPRGEQ